MFTHTLEDVRAVVSGAVRVPRSGSGRRAGFSLIEVLIAVVVLALGLLGVGAVFPVVIRSQRQSQDVIQGQIASRAATAYVMGRKDLLSSLRQLSYDTDSDGTNDDAPLYDASPWFTWSDNSKSIGSVDAGTGALLLPNPDKTSSIKTIYVPVSERLFPMPFTPGIDPQYVWDLAIRRKKSGGCQVVVFTRRIDSQINVPDGYYLSHVLTGSTDSAGKTRLPLAVSKDSQGVPTGNGLGDYSRVRVLQLDKWSADGAKSDGSGTDKSLVTIKRMDDGDASWNASDVVRRAAVAGQKLVDNLGNVYTVVGSVPSKEAGVDWIKLDPPLSDYTWNQKKQGAVVTFVMTPQPPAAVSVIDVEE